MQGWRVYSRVAWAVALTAALVALVGCGAAGGGASLPAATSAPTMTIMATATPRSQARYVALGASDAVGVGASDPNHTAYIPLIIARLPAGSTALNLGISGETLHKALTDELPDAIKAKPTLITIWLVGNDFKNCVPLDQYIADLNTLLTQLQTQTSAAVFVANAPDFSLLPAIRQAAAAGSYCGASSSPDAIRAEVVQWNQAIDAAVAAHHDTLIDLYAGNLAGHPDYISNDGFHPSDAGYQELASLFWSAITAQKAA